MRLMVQILESFDTQDAAIDCLIALCAQENYRGGRILKPTSAKPHWRVQTFHDASGLTLGQWLPDGMMVCLVPDGLLRAVGIL